MSERIWFDDIRGFMTEANYSKFYPSKDMSFAEQLNSLLRFAIYFSILVFVIRKDTNIFFAVIFMAGFTYMLYTVDTKNKVAERFYLSENNLEHDRHTNKLCVKPTKENPFMNILMSDYSENPQRKEACDITKGSVKHKVKKLFDNNLYRDVSDIYDKNASDRNYYTTPITTIPNQQTEYAQFLYGQDKGCKEGNGKKCYQNTYRTIAA